MSTLIRCDVCGKTISKPGKMPSGWTTSCEYVNRGARKVFVRMTHGCPTCPLDVPREAIEDLPVLTETDALREVEESARYAALEEDELRGSARKLLVRALAILDAARDRMGRDDHG